MTPEPDPVAIASVIATAEAAACAADDWHGTVYLIHFAAPLHHAQHYLGWTRHPLQWRLDTHRASQGAKLLKAVNQLGIEWWLVRTWSNQPRSFEKQLKGQHNGRRLCPLCAMDAWSFAREEVPPPS